MNAIEFNRLINCIKRDKTAFERLYNFYYFNTELDVEKMLEHTTVRDVIDEIRSKK